MLKKLSCVALVFLCVSAFGETNPRIDSVEPFRLKVQGAGMVDVTVQGEYPYLTAGHPDMDQYEHWFIRRAGTPNWTMCTRMSDSCQTYSWSHNSYTLKINAAHWLTAPGALEIRMNEGLSEDGNSSWPFSNIATVPVLDAFGAPPLVVSMSKKEFVSGGPESGFVFRIAANNFDPETVAVLFRGDVLVRPIQIIDGSQIEVAVPEKYRNADGELTLQLRTDRGGLSEPQYFKVLKPKTLTVTPLRTGAIGVTPRKIAPMNAGALRVSPDVTLTNQVRQSLTAKLGADVVNAITITATSGVVTLRGSVASADLKAAAENAARIANVKQVVNELTVR